MIIFIIAAIVCVVAVELYACCISAHRADEQMERIIESREEKE